MKSFILAILAVSTFAAEQGIFPTEEVERAPADAMWTNEQIKNWVSVNHGGHEWGAFEQNQLLTDESRQAFVGTMITNMVEEWQTSQNYLPNVCEPGIACRAEVNRDLVFDLEALWKQMLVTIDSKIVTKKATVDLRLEEFYEEAYDCVPGCECDNISIEYDQLIQWQIDLSDRIVEYTHNLNGLIINEQQIIASCPAYIYDSDGNAFFDFSGSGASATVTETETEESSTTTDHEETEEAAMSESTTETTSSATYTVNGVDMSEAEYNAYQAEQAAADSTHTSSSSSSETYTVDGQEMTQAEYEMYMAMAKDQAAHGSMTTTDTSSATYSVGGVDMTEAEYDEYMRQFDGDQTTTSTSSATYTVNGVDMTEAEYEEYMNQSGFSSEIE